jgi:hypothetical protein
MERTLLLMKQNNIAQAIPEGMGTAWVEHIPRETASAKDN